MLNASKGSAVRGPRVQADRRIYRQAVAALVREAGVTVIEGEAASLNLDGGTARGVVLADGSAVDARTIVVTTGTFLGATMFRGEERWGGGRLGGQSADRLGAQVRELGLAEGRLKTGTPPRLDGRTIDWARTAAQPSDRAMWTLALARNPAVSATVTG